MTSYANPFMSTECPDPTTYLAQISYKQQIWYTAELIQIEEENTLKKIQT